VRIGINLFEFFSPGSRGEGVLNYARGLVKALSEIDQENSYVLFLNRMNCEEFSMGARAERHFVVPLDPRKRWARVLWEQVCLPFYARKYRLDVVHCPGGAASVRPLRKCVVTYHAANIFFYYNGNFRNYAMGWKQLYMAAVERFVISKAAAIITDSEYSKHDIIKQLRAHPSKVEVVHLTVPDGDQPRSTPSAFDFPYILDVTSSAVHKNLKTLLAAYALAKTHDPSLPKLVIAGAIPDQQAWGMQSRSELAEIARSRGIESDVIFVPYPKRDALLDLYRHARLFVFPSLFEGFGLAPLEAMKYGLPVVLSDRASLPEVGGDAVIYVNPDDPVDIARGIELGLFDEGLRGQMIERGFRRVESFGNWKRVARQTLAVYEQVGRAKAQGRADGVI
jgi:glycosyltransferase involved in cell wall biosynthesis